MCFETLMVVITQSVTTNNYCRNGTEFEWHSICVTLVESLEGTIHTVVYGWFDWSHKPGFTQHPSHSILSASWSRASHSNSVWLSAINMIACVWVCALARECIYVCECECVCVCVRIHKLREGD